MHSLSSGRFFKIVALAAGFALVLSHPCQGAAKRGGGGGGVMLSTPEPNTPIEHNNRGVELGSKGLWPQAIHEHELALAADPNNKEFRTNLSAAQLRYGDLLASKHDWYNAIKQYRGALYVDPNNTPADQHLDDCLRAIKKNPDDLHTRQHMAEDADVSGDYETAIVEYRKCVRMADDGPNHARLGRVLIKAGKVVDGYNELVIAVAKPWENKDKQDLGAAHRQLGDILKEYAYIAKNSGRGTVGMKRLLNAGIEYRRAVTLNPADVDAGRSLVEVARAAVAINPCYDNHMMLGGAYQLIGDFEHAKMEYEECWKVNPNAASLPIARKSYYLAVVKSPLTPPALLQSTINKIHDSLQRNPNDPELLYLFGRGKESQGEKEIALQAYQRAAQINAFVNPDLKPALSRLGGAPADAGTKTAAKPAKVQQADEDAAKNVMKYAEIESKMRSGDTDTAQKDLMDIVEKNPREAHAWFLLGSTHEKKGDLDQAAVAYRQAALLKDPAADDALRQVNTSRVQPSIQEADKALADKNLVAAASALRQAASIGPNLSFVHKKLADVLKQLGDTKEADREMKKAAELDKNGS